MAPPEPASSSPPASPTEKSGPGEFSLNLPKREQLGSGRARELLEPLLRPTAEFHTVRLGGCSWSDRAALVAASALKGLARKGCLEVVSLADTIAKLNEDEALKVLTSLCAALDGCKTLLAIDLSDNALGERGVAACAPLLQGQSALREVRFCNNGLAPGAAKLIRTFLVSSTSLTTIHFHNNLLETPGALQVAPLVAAATNLQDLRFSSLRAGAPGSAAVARALANTTSLRRLDMSDNTLGAEGVELLADALVQQPNLVYLNLRDTSMQDEEAEQIITAIVDSGAPIETLDLSGNDLTANFGTILGQYLQELPTLVQLLLDDNELGDAGVLSLTRELRGGDKLSLEEFSLTSNGIHRSGAIAVAASMRRIPAIKRVNLSYNSIPEQTIAKITDLFNESTTFLFDDNDLDATDEEETDPEKESLVSELLAGLEAEPGSTTTSAVSQLISYFSRLGLSRGERAAVGSGRNRRASPAVLSGAPHMAMTTSTTGLPQGKKEEDIEGASSEKPSALVSAQRLREQTRCLKKDVADVIEELSDLASASDMAGVPPGAMVADSGPINGRDGSRLLARRSKSSLESCLDLIGGFLVSSFLVMLILAFIQSQEEYSFSYAPI